MQEEDVVELIVAGCVLSFDCQETKFPDDWDNSDPVPTTNTFYQLSTRSEEKEVLVVEPIFIFHTPRSKDNNINSESTKRNDPTKRLDKVDDDTGRIAYNTSITTLEINRDTLLKEGTIKIGHPEDKRLLFTNDIRA